MPALRRVKGYFMAKSKYTNIGGQALLEGVMMRGSVHTAMAVRNMAGDVEIEM